MTLSGGMGVSFQAYDYTKFLKKKNYAPTDLFGMVKGSSLPARNGLKILMFRPGYSGLLQGKEYIGKVVKKNSLPFMQQPTEKPPFHLICSV